MLLECLRCFFTALGHLCICSRGSESPLDIPRDLSVNYPKTVVTLHYFAVLFLKSRSEQHRFRFACYPSREVVGTFQKHLQDKCGEAVEVHST